MAYSEATGVGTKKGGESIANSFVVVPLTAMIQEERST